MGPAIARTLDRVRTGCAVPLAVVAAQILSLHAFADAAVTEVDSELFHTEPEIGWVWGGGDHHLDFAVAFRYRYENWQAFAADNSDLHGLRTRFGLDYRYREGFRLLVEGQQASLFSLDGPARASGELRLYRAVAGESDANSIHLNRLFAELSGAGGLWVRLGRDYVNAVTLADQGASRLTQARAEVARREQPSWAYLARDRLGERLLGSIDWSHGARAYDGVTAGAKLGPHQRLRGWVLQPTTGVYDLKDGYDFQRDVLVGGIEWTATRGGWLEDTEIGAFFIAFSDGRDAANVRGLEGDIELYTFGASWLGLYPVGPGRLDALAWGALQFGDYVDRGPASGTRTREQLAGAFVAELGYQLPERWAAPWLRLGVNYGSGDGDLDDADRSTFFNILPSNHPYYGYADQLALQNLLDVLVQLRLVPTERIRMELTWHRFWLDESADFRWSGTGAFERSSLGYVRNPSNGSRDVGHELDLVVRAALDNDVSLAAGYAAMWGGGVFAPAPDRDLDFVFVEMAFAY